MHKTKRIGIVGCGAIAKTHGLAIQDLGYECVAVTDIRPEAAENFAHNYPELRADWLTAAEWMSQPARKKLREMFPSPKVYPNLPAMREAGPLDAVIIATLPGSHCELTLEAARIGAKAVLCEKPMAISDEECRRMMEGCKELGSRLAVYHEAMVLLDQFVQARQIIASGQIGKVSFIRANTVSTLMDWSPYLWAGILHMIPRSRISFVEAILDTTKQTYSFGHLQEDRATVHFMMDGDVHGVLFTGQEGFSPHGIRIDGSEGSLEISFIKAPTLRFWRQGTKSWEVVTPPRSCLYDDRRSFLEGIVTGDPLFDKYDGESARKSMLPVFAAWQSYRERRPVALDKEIAFSIPLQA